MDEAYIIAQNTAANVSIPNLPFQATTSAVDGNILCLTNQGDGIHFVAVEDSSPLASLTLGPSARYSTAAVAKRSRDLKQSLICVGVHGKAEAWLWKAETEVDGSFVKEPTLQSIKLQKPIIALAVLDSETGPAFATVDTEGQLSVVDEDFKVLSKTLLFEKAAPQTTTSARIEVISGSSDSTSTSLLVTLFGSTNSPTTKKAKPRKSKGILEEGPFSRTTHLHFISVLPDSLNLIKSINLLETDIVDLSYSMQPRLLSILCKSGIWQIYQVSADYDLKLTRTLPLALPQIDITRPASTSSQAVHLLALHDSFVLLSAPLKNSNTNKVSLSIWDLRFCVPIATSELDLTAKYDCVTLTSLSTYTAVLAHSTTSHTRTYGIPLQLPATSSLASVLGKQSAATRFLVPTVSKVKAEDDERKRKLAMHPLSSEAKVVFQTECAASRQALLEAVDQANATTSIDDLFGEWLERETQRRQAYVDAKEAVRAEAKKERQARRLQAKAQPSGSNKDVVNKKNSRWQPDEDAPAAIPQVSGRTRAMAREEQLSDDEPTMVADRDGGLEGGESSAHESGSEQKGKAPKAKSTERFTIGLSSIKPALPVNFVAHLVRSCLDDKFDKVRPVKTLRYLLERRVVSNRYAPDGVIIELHRAELWSLLEIALKVISDIPESNIIALLKDSLATTKAQHHDQHSIPFSRLLNKTITYPLSPKLLRQALANVLSLNDVRRCLSLLNHWIDYWNDPSAQSPNRQQVPPLDNILSFTALLIDSHFVGLLQDRSSFKLLQTLAGQLHVSAAINDDILSLKGPLDSIKREHAKLNKVLTPAEAARAKVEEEAMIGAYALDIFVV